MLSFMVNNPVTKSFPKNNNAPIISKYNVEVMQGLNVKGTAFSIVQSNPHINYRTYEQAVQEGTEFLDAQLRPDEIETKYREIRERGRFLLCGGRTRMANANVFLDQRLQGNGRCKKMQH